MAIAKICGIETEYGIQIRGNESNPILASSLLISSYVVATSKKSNAQGINWDFCDEQPDIDARGFSYEDSFAPEIESHLVNAVLTNGARYYVDHAHPEISTPECRTALEVLAFDCSAEEIVRRSMKLAQPFLGPQAEMVLYKNNSDGKGNSYGCHENFLVSREVPFGRLVTQITPHFVTRQIFSGAGKVGCEIPGVSEREVPYQISQRADFFEEEVGLETTLRRPIVNTRDEPHCDPQKYRRLHVIVGDANMSQTATLLKVGTTSLILAMIEDEVLPVDLSLAHPVPAIRQVSYDLTLRQTLLLRDGRRMSALDIQWALLEMASKYSISHGLECLGGQDDGEQILHLWETVLNGLSGEPDSVAHLVDWVAKKRLVDGYSQRHDLQPGDSRLKAIDLQYHDMREEKCLALRVGLDQIVTDEQIQRGVTEPPDSTRAFFRGKCLERWPNQVISANWDSMVFEVDKGPLRRVPMMEPMRGSKELVGHLFDSATSLAEFLEQLGV